MLTLLGFICLYSCIYVREKPADRKSAFEHKVDSLLALMTLEEKIGQMTQVRHFDLNNDEEIRK
jgi:beta-glucosidase